MPVESTAGTERVRYHDGQLLASSDLRDDMAFESRQRGLHVRALHDTWGIALGLTVELHFEPVRLRVGPGLAYDCHGGEMFLALGVEVEIPPMEKGDEWVLVLRRPDEPWVELRDARSACLPGGEGGLSSIRPRLLWRKPERVRPGEEVPLGSVRDGVHGLSLSFAVRRNARPLNRPHVGRGLFTASRWDDWNSGDNVGLQVQVDTKAAGFVQTPFYFVQTQTPAWDQNQGTVDELIGPFASLDSPTAQGFTYRLLFALRDNGNAAGQARQLIGTPRLFWIGVEPAAGCEPVWRPEWNVILFPIGGWIPVLGGGG